jgi:hypothetical protein
MAFAGLDLKRGLPLDDGQGGGATSPTFTAHRLRIGSLCGCDELQALGERHSGSGVTRIRRPPQSCREQQGSNPPLLLSTSLPQPLPNADGDEEDKPRLHLDTLPRGGMLNL